MWSSFCELNILCVVSVLLWIKYVFYGICKSIYSVLFAFLSASITFRISEKFTNLCLKFPINLCWKHMESHLKLVFSLLSLSSVYMNDDLYRGCSVLLFITGHFVQAKSKIILNFTAHSAGFQLIPLEKEFALDELHRWRWFVCACAPWRCMGISWALLAYMLCCWEVLVSTRINTYLHTHSNASLKFLLLLTKNGKAKVKLSRCLWQKH